MYSRLMQYIYYPKLGLTMVTRGPSDTMTMVTHVVDYGNAGFFFVVQIIKVTFDHGRFYTIMANMYIYTNIVVLMIILVSL